MRLQINGQQRDLPAPLTVVQLLEQLQLPTARVVVELNHNILTADTLADHHLKDGDSLELVQLVGGG